VGSEPRSFSSTPSRAYDYHDRLFFAYRTELPRLNINFSFQLYPFFLQYSYIPPFFAHKSSTFTPAICRLFCLYRRRSSSFTTFYLLNSQLSLSFF
jgi:hypothetical protein